MLRSNLFWFLQVRLNQLEMCPKKIECLLDEYFFSG